MLRDHNIASPLANARPLTRHRNEWLDKQNENARRLAVEAEIHDDLLLTKGKKHAIS